MASSVTKRLRQYLPWNGFGDGRKAIFGHPYFIARSALRSRIAIAAAVAPPGPLLDVGCGSMPYRDLFPASHPYECLEIDQPRNQNKQHVTYLYDGHGFGLDSDTFAVTFSSQTLEHSFSPEEMLTEMYRVLRPGGVLILAMPFFWPEHEQPYDSQRFTSFGLKARLDAIGFEDACVAKTNPGSAALLQLAIEIVERHVRRGLASIQGKSARRTVETLLRMLLAAPYFVAELLAIIIRRFTRDMGRAELYLDLVVTATKPVAARTESGA